MRGVKEWGGDIDWIFRIKYELIIQNYYFSHVGTYYE